MELNNTDLRQLKHLSNRSEIIDVILLSAYAMDTHDWPMLRSCLDEQIYIDYSALRGKPPQLILADDYVAQREREAELSHLKTQHISTNHLIVIAEDNAKCNCCFLIHRLDPTTEKTFDTAGHYTYALIRKNEAWLINAIIQTVLWSRGEPKIHGAFKE